MFQLRVSNYPTGSMLALWVSRFKWLGSFNLAGWKRKFKSKILQKLISYFLKQYSKGRFSVFP